MIDGMCIYGIGCRADEYCDMLVRRGRKESTAKAVRNSVLRCSGWLAAHGIVRAEDVDVEAVAEMAAGIGGKESTRRQVVSGFAGYYRWLTGEDVVKRARLLWNPAECQVDRTWITAEEYRRMMDASQPRERLMLALGATMGLRRAEMCALTLDDVRGGVVRIRGKGHGEGKEVPKPMSEAVRRELAGYLAVRPRSASEALLLSAKGEALDPGSVYWLVTRIGRSVGVEVSPHTLRRLYATTLADAGVPLETISRMMRHETVETTMRCYLRADPRRMREASTRVDEALAVLRGQGINTMTPITETQSGGRASEVRFNIKSGGGRSGRTLCRSNGTCRKSAWTGYASRCTTATRRGWTRPSSRGGCISRTPSTSSRRT